MSAGRNARAIGMLMGSPYRHEGAPPEAYRAWNIAPNDYGTLVETLNRIEAAGMELAEMMLSSREDWYRFEAAPWMVVSDHRRAYLQYARHGFGFCVFVLRRAP